MNTRRHTPGLLLSAWALGMSALVLFSWRIYLHRQEFEWSEYPTALGDPDLYTAALTENDYYLPALKFTAAPAGLYRQSVQPIGKADRLMQRVEREATGRHVVYVEALRPDSGRYFLKAGQDQYVAFGQRKHWPAYVVPTPAKRKAVPISEEDAKRLMQLQ